MYCLILIEVYNNYSSATRLKFVSLIFKYLLYMRESPCIFINERYTHALFYSYVFIHFMHEIWYAYILYATLTYMSFKVFLFMMYHISG